MQKVINVEDCPEVMPRRQYYSEEELEAKYPDNEEMKESLRQYEESDRDWFDNNRDACIWFLEQILEGKSFHVK